MARNLGVSTCVILTAGNNKTSAIIDNHGRSGIGIYVPALGAGSTIEVQGSYDGTGANLASIMGADGTTKAGLIASSSGGFWISGTILDACKNIPYLAVVLGTHQAADVTLQISQGV